MPILFAFPSPFLKSYIVVNGWVELSRSLSMNKIFLSAPKTMTKVTMALIWIG